MFILLFLCFFISIKAQHDYSHYTVCNNAHGWLQIKFEGEDPLFIPSGAQYTLTADEVSKNCIVVYDDEVSIYYSPSSYKFSFDGNNIIYTLNFLSDLKKFDGKKMFKKVGVSFLQIGEKKTVLWGSYPGRNSYSKDAVLIGPSWKESKVYLRIGLNKIIVCTGNGPSGRCNTEDFFITPETNIINLNPEENWEW